MPSGMKLVHPGWQRLSAVYNTGAWRALPSLYKKRRQRGAIDRRFFGEKNRRTRDFGSDDEDEDGGGFWFGF